MSVVFHFAVVGDVFNQIVGRIHGHDIDNLIVAKITRTRGNRDFAETAAHSEEYETEYQHEYRRIHKPVGFSLASDFI